MLPGAPASSSAPLPAPSAAASVPVGSAGPRPLRGASRWSAGGVTPFQGKWGALFSPGLGAQSRPCAEQRGQRWPGVRRDRGTGSCSRSVVRERCAERAGPRLAPGTSTRARVAGGGDQLPPREEFSFFGLAEHLSPRPSRPLPGPALCSEQPCHPAPTAGPPRPWVLAARAPTSRSCGEGRARSLCPLSPLHPYGAPARALPAAPPSVSSSPCALLPRLTWPGRRHPRLWRAARTVGNDDPGARAWGRGVRGTPLTFSF